MGILDVPFVKSPLAPRGATKVAWLGDSLTANGSSPTSIGMTLNAGVAAGATQIVCTSVSASYPSATAPVAGNVLVLDRGGTNEEWVVVSGVSGAGPYTITVPALVNAHAAGATVRTEARLWTAQSVPMWAAILSSSRVRFGGVFAHGSYTTQEVKDVYLPQILALDPLPGAVVVNLATNDVYDPAVLPIYTSILDTLIHRGILPVVVNNPPRNTMTQALSSTITKWNHALARECLERGVPYIDIYRAMTNDGSGTGNAGGYKTTYNVDDVHPSEIGAKAWAQAIVDAVSATWPFYADPLAPAHNTYGGDLLAYPSNPNNAVLLTDTNADGIPDGWTKLTGNAGDTVALVSESGVPGKMFSITRAAAGATDAAFVVNTFTLVPGHKYRVFLRLKTTGVDAAYENQRVTSGAGGGNTTSNFLGFDVRLTTAVADTDALFTIWTWRRDIPLTLLVAEFVAPKGLSSNSVQWRVNLRGSAASPAYTVEVQPWIVDLTSAGAA